LPVFPVTAGELSRRLAERGPEAFLRLVNAVLSAWASAHGPGIRLRLNEISYLPDDGIDAVLKLPSPVGELPRGRIIFQLKWRDVQRNVEKDLWNRLGSKIDREIRNLLERETEPPAAYVLVTNLRLGEREQRSFIETREQTHCGLPAGSFHLWEASRLLSELRAHPQIVYWILGGPAALSLDEAETTMLRRAKLLDLPWPARFVGRNRVKQTVEETVGKAGSGRLILHGAPGMGTTRALLEALRPFEGQVIWFDGVLPSDSDLRQLTGSSRAIVAIDQPPELEGLDRLVTGPLKLPVIAAVSGTALPPGIRRMALELPPLTHDEMETLLRSLVELPAENEIHLDFLQESWIERHAEGRPGLAVALAAEALTAEEPDENEPLRSWIDRLLQGLESKERQVLKFLAALGPIGARGERAEEFLRLLEAFGIVREGLGSTLQSLERRGLVIFHGRIADVAPAALAETLAAEWLGEQQRGTVRLVLELEDGMQRFLRLLARGKGSPVATRLARELLALRFHSLTEVITAAVEYRQVALVVPDEAIDHLEALLGEDPPPSLAEEVRRRHRKFQGHSPEELFEQFGENFWEIQEMDPLQELCWFCEEAVFRGVETRRAETPVKALQILAHLAAASVELGRPESQMLGTFSEVMVPRHPEVIIGLEDRKKLLDALVEAGGSAHRRVALEALVAVYESVSSFTFRYRSGSSPKPLRAVPVSADEIRRYNHELVPTLERILVGHQDLPGKRLEDLVNAAILAFGRLDDEDGLNRVVGTVAKVFPTDPSSIGIRKKAISALEILSTESAGERRERTEALRRVLYPDEGASFEERLVWLVSEATWVERNEAMKTHRAMPEHSFASLEKLAKEAAGDPDLLDRDLAVWVLQEAPFGHLFGASMGRAEADREQGPALARRFLLAEPATKGQKIEASWGWEAYVGAWCSAIRDGSRVAKLLRDLLGAGYLELAARVTFSVDPAALAWRELWAVLRDKVLSSQPGSAETVRKSVSHSHWARALPQPDLVELLRDLLDAGAAPLEVVKVLLVRGDPLDPCSLDLAMMCLERWTDRLRDWHGLDDLLGLEPILEAVAKTVTDRYVNWFLRTVQVVMKVRGIGLPTGSEPVFRLLMDLARAHDSKLIHRFLDTLARASEDDPGVLLGYSGWGKPLVDPTRDREAILGFAARDPELMARILDTVVQPPDPFFVRTVASQQGRSAEAVLSEREQQYFDLLEEVVRRSGAHGALLKSVERAFHRLLLSNSTMQLARAALKRLRAWESDDDRKLSRWATRFRPQYERSLQQQARWDDETLFWDSDLTHEDARSILAGDTNDPRRRWLIGRILKDLPFEEAIRLLDPSDVSELLDEIENLSPARRRMWEKWIRDHAPVS